MKKNSGIQMRPLITETEIYLDKPGGEKSETHTEIREKGVELEGAYSSVLRWNRADTFEEHQKDQEQGRRCLKAGG